VTEHPYCRDESMRLARGSRRRRRLMLLSLNAVHGAEASVETPPGAGQTEAPTEEWAALRASVPAELDAAVQARLSRMLAAREPLTWMLAGESFLDLENPSHDFPSFVDSFTDLLRSLPDRSSDAIINACCSRSRVAGVRRRLPNLLTQVRADVLFLLIGPADVAGGVQDLPAF
jgi:hypothetical protein